MEERRDPSDLSCGCPQQREPRQFLIVTVHVGGIDPPDPVRRHVGRNPSQCEPVDAERERTERQRHEARGEGDAQ